MKLHPLLLALVLLASPALASPTLKPDVVVTAPVVTVGDMFDDAGDLAGAAIFRAPAPGTTGIVAVADIRRAAALAGLDTFDTLGLETIRVARASTVIGADDLARLIQQNLADRGLIAGKVTARVDFARTDFALNAEVVPNPAELLDLRYSPSGRAFTARFHVAGIDQSFDLTGNIELMTTAPRLIGNQPAGTILAPADFEQAAVPLAVATAGGYADLDQLLGKQLLRQSQGGIMLKPTDVADPTVVKRNDLVTVVLRVGAMTLTVKGISLGTVAAGQPVDVLNTTTKKVLHGIAQADGSVAIVTATVASL
jgi:flagella basal body P-ring formation protein FlgA